MDLRNVLIEALPVIARISGGYATVTDKNGKRIKTVDSQGNTIEEMQDQIFEMAELAGKTGLIQYGVSQLNENAEAWALPLGDYVLATSNLERILKEKELYNAMEEALPLIAKVTGGEAVLFDKYGKRMDSVDYDGNKNLKLVGYVSEAAKKSMLLQKPVLGESTSVIGAMAVRIPITKEFGIGLNNEQRVKKQQKLIEEVKKYQYAKYTFSDIIGKSEAMQKVKSIASFVANGVSSILIFGETGTGKELFAQSIHNESNRRSKPFVAINCGALPSSIIESYLFGYEEGAFTGAKKTGNPGAFEQANGGTIYLDELSEMDYDLQSKLLRVLQEREVTRIGNYKPIKLDVRVIASTNRDLEKLITEGRFREDLYYRLNVVQFKIPPLRDRIEDIPDIAKSFIHKYNNILGRYVLNADEDVINVLCSYNWPGNVRQLQNCIEHAMNMTGINENTLKLHHLPGHLCDIKTPDNKMEDYNLKEYLNKAEYNAIVNALKHSKGVKKDCAKLLGISTVKLWRRIKELGIDYVYDD